MHLLADLICESLRSLGAEYYQQRLVCSSSHVPVIIPVVAGLTAVRQRDSVVIDSTPTSGDEFAIRRAMGCTLGHDYAASSQHSSIDCTSANSLHSRFV